jgi:hypothetical protein
MPDTLIPLRPQTDFEKLLFERSANKDLLREIVKLNIEIGKLKAEIDHQVFQNKELAGQINNISLAARVPDKRDFKRRYELSKRRCHILSLRVRDLRKTNNELVCKIVKLSKKI